MQIGYKMPNQTISVCQKSIRPPFPFPFPLIVICSIDCQLVKRPFVPHPFFFNWKLIPLQSPPPPSRPHFDIPAPYLTRDPSMLNRVQAL